ncbi:hypothetical protein SSX86_007488 [Deinandra increscens subsp. villosa]|uniref:Uncharacterized protein n=1 Tax=Deinandra increscens subsp. villosa TaxID=3103831 RepID=A0AAP0DL92_9ASTR
MCYDSWGRSSFARALIEISADHEYMETIKVSVPDPDGEDFLVETIRVEYEWQPPRCNKCCVFSHDTEHCPHRVKEHQKYPVNQVDEEGFVEPNKKKVAKKGVPVRNQKAKLVYRPVSIKASDQGTSSSSKPITENKETRKEPTANVSTHNPFDILEGGEDRVIQMEELQSFARKMKDGNKNKMSYSDIEVLDETNETAGFMASGLNLNKKGASTPSGKGPHD